MVTPLNRCEHVIRRAGATPDGQSMPLGGYGDRTQVCGKFGRAVPHIYYTLKPGTATVTIAHEGTVIRCSEHEWSA